MSPIRAHWSRSGCRAAAKRNGAEMYFDRRLWELTRGLRGRIALAIALGVCASGFGIARVVFLGLLLAAVFVGAGSAPLALLAGALAAAVLLRALLDHARTV